MFLQIATDAVGLVFSRKSPSDSDGFLKYFYGCFKGLLSDYLDSLLGDFCAHIEGLSELELLTFYEELTNVSDGSRLYELQVDEYERELGARDRRSSRRPVYLSNWLEA
ncbi:hypothetical protein HXA34_02970 [Salipaludibacillus agaradhaerens]|uniref:hypothetical protein n=1 Tax=Salipaludibacillus agaradhaerens TaxID=76935 RepID=UPI00215118E9|nr:hypothetical protein [Salipaludibacillus agaradhaerens]MCR6105251.1 hypothetical protein [Salipaludibacillus agaradhaerens]MCR6117293.1 hypothetical protein [Salipaludibacillus agaradhaerens]